jgi:hypothetical protein
MVRIGQGLTGNQLRREPIMKAIMLLAVAAGGLWAASVAADTIYTWTDADGIRRYSNDPPTGVESYQRIDTPAERPDRPDAGNERRPSYDQMIQQAIQENQQLEQERRDKEAARAAEEKRLAEELRQKKIEAERSRLLQQIEAIKNRAVSPTYPPGMKKAQIDKIQEQIDALEKSPDAVASPKQGKPADSKSGY